MVLGAVRSTVRIVSMATYGTNARVSDIVCRCCRVRYGSVEGSVGVLVESLTAILRKLDADFTSEKLLRYFGIQRQIESIPARLCVRIRRHGSDVYLGMSPVQNCGSYLMY